MPREYLFIAKIEIDVRVGESLGDGGEMADDGVNAKISE